MTRPYGERLAQYRSLLGEDPALAPLSPSLDPGDPAGAVAGLVLAPALGGFTQWLLAWAKGRGIKRLYFLARDGYCFLRAARALSDTAGKIPVTWSRSQPYRSRPSMSWVVIWEAADPFR